MTTEKYPRGGDSGLVAGAVSVEVESPATSCNFVAVALDGADGTPVDAGSDAEVPVPEHGVAVTGNDQVAGRPKTVG